MSQLTCYRDQHEQLHVWNRAISQDKFENDADFVLESEQDIKNFLMVYSIEDLPTGKWLLIILPEDMC